MKDFWCCQFLAACYQLKIGSVLAERVGQVEVGGSTALADSARQPLQLPVEKPWSMPGGPFEKWYTTAKRVRSGHKTIKCRHLCTHECISTGKI